MNKKSVSRRSVLVGTLAGVASLPVTQTLLASGAPASAAPASAPASAAPAPAPAGPIVVPPLPYAENALEPHLSARTLGFHYGKHHKGYATRANELLVGSPLATPPSGLKAPAATTSGYVRDLHLEEIIKKTAQDSSQAPLFNATAQVFNHTFYWHCMKGGGGGQPTGKLLDAITQSFGSFGKFREAFVKSASGVFGSGWAWLVVEGGTLKIVQTKDADTPIVRNQVPLLTVDVWEHAYYLEWQNRRKDYIEEFLNSLVNWEFVAQQLPA